ncbi:hypothetical protein JXC34_00820 [Candidatus Woesearchaeota archaeon]|nr:hypothetical protein [Candidatus Woesearchaeota archaeon]
MKSTKNVSVFLVLFLLLVVVNVKNVESSTCCSCDYGDSNACCCEGATCIGQDWQCGWYGCRGYCISWCGCKPKCGDNSINQGWEECDGSRAPCGNFAQSCSGCICRYYETDLSAGIVAPCVNESIDSRGFQVQGQSGYCGVLTITTPWGETQTVGEDTLTQDYSFSASFTIPIDYVAQSILGQPIPIQIEGNRNSIKAARDEATYDCSMTLDMVVEHDNIFYCPRPGESFARMDYYDGSEYYVTDLDGNPMAWEIDDGNYNCLSSSTNVNCCPNATDCVADDNTCQQVGYFANVDSSSDPELEVCFSLNNLQGGWADADSREEVCDLADQFSETYGMSNEFLWLDCSSDEVPDSKCYEGVDDYDGDKISGFCCGDDPDENYVTTSVKSGSYVLALSFEGCCDSEEKCVDETGICRNLGETQCMYHVSGYQGTCTEGPSGPEWQLSPNEECLSYCDMCDFNKQGGHIDILDLEIISSHYSDSVPYDETYDVNGDGSVDDWDYDFCRTFLNQICTTCEDNVLQDHEMCEIVDDEIVYSQENCPESMCGGGTVFPDFLYAVMNREEGCDTDFGCLCIYTPSCQEYQCGFQCDDDQDCSNVLHKFCLETGLSGDLSTYVVEKNGDAGFREEIRDGPGCCDPGEYYVRNYGSLKVEIPMAIGGEYKMSFSYRSGYEGKDDENIIINCGGRNIYLADEVLEYYKTFDDEFSEFPGITCNMVSGDNTITITSDGTDAVYVSSLSFRKIGDPYCNPDTCSCIDTGSCGDGTYNLGETCDNSAPGHPCPTESQCQNTAVSGKTGVLVGNAGYCDARCVYYDTKACGSDDDYCPPGCLDDPDCDPICTDPDDFNPDSCSEVTDCISGDNCCPDGCLGDDPDCGWLSI